MQDGPSVDLLAPVEPDGTTFNQYVGLGINHAILTIQKNFEQTSDYKNKLLFHNAAHTLGVISRTESILNAVRAADPTLVDDRTFQLGRFAAAFHDVVQN